MEFTLKLLGNFRSHDPFVPGVGLTRGNRLEQLVWNEFAEDQAGLKKIAKAIAKAASTSTAIIYESEVEFPEGALLTRLHRSRERNRSAVRRKKADVIKRTGRLACEVCGFDFEETYGTIGKEFAECHHLQPISELTDRKSVRLADLAILCANCHRMIHQTRPLQSVDAFRNDYMSHGESNGKS